MTENQEDSRLTQVGLENDNKMACVTKIESSGIALYRLLFAVVDIWHI